MGEQRKMLRLTAFGGDAALCRPVADIVRNVLDVYLMQRFIIRWRGG